MENLVASGAAQPLPLMMVRQRILAVDDDEVNRAVLGVLLERFGYEAVLAESGPEALQLLDAPQFAGSGFDAILLDIMMPGMDGYEVARTLKARPEMENVPIIMVTALSDRGERLKSVESGAADFIAKPIDSTELRVRLRAQLDRKTAVDALRLHKEQLEVTVEQRTLALRQSLAEVTRLQQQTRVAHLETLYCLASAMEFKDFETSEHIQRMSQCAALLARRIGHSDEDVERILHASPLHDVGKIGIPDNILLKPGKLTPEEWGVMKTHTTIGAKILAHADTPYIRTGRLIALSHHEKWDGSGYPQGLRGEDIPIEGRICALADVFDALLSERPYKKPFSPQQTFEMIKADSGTHFDPALVEVFLGNYSNFLAIHDIYE